MSAVQQLNKFLINVVIRKIVLLNLWAAPWYPKVVNELVEDEENKRVGKSRYVQNKEIFEESKESKGQWVHIGTKKHRVVEGILS